MCLCAGLATVYVRYKQVEALAVGGETRLHQFNSAALTLGCLSALGMCIVANFQVNCSICSAPSPLKFSSDKNPTVSSLNPGLSA